MVLVAHSLGGHLAAVCVLKYSHRVAKLVLVSSAGIDGKPEHLVEYDRTDVLDVVKTKTLKPWGPAMTGLYTSGRFAHLPDHEIDQLKADAPAGEFALNVLIQFGIYGKWPLEERLGAVVRKLPIRFIYGDDDWMGPQYADQWVRNVAPERNVRQVVRIVPDADRQVFVDNSPGFNEVLLSVLVENR
ncbi:hypothetical protein GGF31_006057 [Allomyces arbusculus]|nr:hypothetical protein GGF31_006057 [Allomyces arbusculus]